MIGITIILVLYKTELHDSISYKTLQQCRHLLSWANTRLIIFNNSPETEVPQSGEYIAVNSGHNSKLYGAYSYALQYAEKNGFDWLMLLDQDSELTEQYFIELKRYFETCENENTAAIVPTLKSGITTLSPHKYKVTSGPLWYSKNLKPGKIDTYMAAFNSCTVVNVGKLLSIGGFPQEYPLDSLDTCYFYRLKKKGYDFFLLPVIITHNLSLLDYKHMTRERYASIIEADNRLAKEMGRLTVFFLKIRLLCRCLKFATDKYKRKYIGLTLANLF